MTVAARLAELGISLPEPAKAVANYVPFVQTGNLVHISGQLSNNAAGGIKGTVGADVSPEQAKDGARMCGVNLLAQISAACDGDLGLDEERDRLTDRTVAREHVGAAEGAVPPRDRVGTVDGHECKTEDATDRHHNAGPLHVVSPASAAARASASASFHRL